MKRKRENFSLNCLIIEKRRLVFFSFDGKKIVTVWKKRAVVWNSLNGKLLFLFRETQKQNFVGLLSPDDKKIVTASKHDGIAKVWDASNGKLLFDLVGHDDRVYAAMFSPDSSKVVTASGDRTVKLLDFAT